MMNARETTTSGDGAGKTQEAKPRTGKQPDAREKLPTRDYAALVAIFNGLLATVLLTRRCLREPLPDRIEPRDLALFALSTQKLSRVITKDKVTSAFRAPFTEVEGKGAAGELEERGRGQGLRRAIGDLLTCPATSSVRDSHEPSRASLPLAGWPISFSRPTSRPRR